LQVAERLQVEVAYALADRQWLRIVDLVEGASVGEAVEASGLAAEIGLAGPLDLGVSGRRCAPDSLLRDGDRVEIYRPLSFDPMESRRRRAAKTGRR
jgi:putative ubiquitin-RnfH superfamily antitoxin RatB of RatAB toxin-antitoxin module